jgi:Tfp pilus assembly protein PilF
VISQSVKLMAQDYFELAYELQMQGELDRAMYYYGRSIDCVESPEAYTFMAWTESMRGNFEPAIRLCRHAISLDPEFGNPLNDLGAYLLALDRPMEAIPYLEQAVKAPRYLTYHYAHYNLGRAYEKLGHRERAQREYRRALELDSSYALARDAMERLQVEMH